MMEARYIPYSEREKYEAEGWTVTMMIGHHSCHSLLAVRPV
jgi:hypothetical protein